MPLWTNYVIETETVVRIRDERGRNVASFQIMTDGKSNSNQGQLEKDINKVVQGIAEPASYYSAAVGKLEEKRLA